MRLSHAVPCTILTNKITVFPICHSSDSLSSTSDFEPGAGIEPATSRLQIERSTIATIPAKKPLEKPAAQLNHNHFELTNSHEIKSWRVGESNP